MTPEPPEHGRTGKRPHMDELVNHTDPVLCHINIAQGYRGGERQTELLVRELASHRWRQRLVVRTGNPLAGRCADIPHLEIVEVAGNPLSAAVAVPRQSLVHAHDARSIYAAWLGSIIRHVPYLFTRRVDNPLRPSRFRDAAYRKSGGIVAVSRAVAGEIRKRYPGIECTILPDAATNLARDPVASDAIRRRYPGRTLIGHVGALEQEQKGQLTIIEAARRAASEHPDWHFLLLGQGRDEARFRAAMRGLDNIELAGQVDNVGTWFGAFDLFVFPSLHEGLGSSLLDAMSFGLPIVASGVGGIPEIVQDGINGLLVGPGDVEAFYRAIERIVDDPSLARRVSEANRTRAEEFSPAHMAAAYERTYRSVLDKANGRAHS